MKILLVLVILLSEGLQAQNPLDTGFYLGAITDVHRKEHRMLSEMELKQVALTNATTAIAISSTLYAKTETKLYKSISSINDIIAHSSPVISIVKSSKKIMAIQDKILALSKTNPDIAPIAAEAEVLWLQKASHYMLQLLMATKGSNFSIMSNAQRINLLNQTAEELALIVKETINLYNILYLVSKEEANLLEPIIYDVEPAIQEAKKQIENLAKIN